MVKPRGERDCAHGLHGQGEMINDVYMQLICASLAQHLAVGKINAHLSIRAATKFAKRRRARASRKA